MKMKRCLSATILLVLSLEAALLVAGSPSAAAVVGTIRLPSDAEVTKPARPWKCCDELGVCTRSSPPTCNCVDDEVEQCAPTCKNCTESTLHPSLFVCNDRYFGDPGPICRPWKCCDSAPCTKSIPPICRCGDVVDQCAPTCKNCEASMSDPSRYVCKDIYRGFPGPMCTAEGNNGGN